MHRALVAVWFATATFFSPASFGSVILSTSPNVLETAIPASLKKDTVQSNTTIFAYREQQNVTLASTLFVNFTATGTYHPLLTNEAPSSAINSGTVLDSYLFHFDMFFTGVNARALGTVTFDSNILGIIGTHNTLVSTDSWLGIPTTLYETTTPMFGGRGLEGADFSTAASRDWSAISADRRTLTLDLGVGEWFDDVRVLVASNPSAVPSPASLPLIVIGLSILLFVRQSTSS